MSKRPWMPLYIADYLRDTSHLRALESGAYLHLIMAYWVNGKLPNDDKQLATIAKVSDREWKSIKAVLAEFFGDGWSSHKRIDTEIAKAADVSNKRKAAVQQREIKRRSNDTSNDDTLHTSQSQRKKGIDSGDLLDAIAEVVGVPIDDPSLSGFYHQLTAMMARGFSRETILAGAANAMRGKSSPPVWSYFAKCIESENEQRSKPAKPEIARGKSESLTDTAKRLAGEVVGFGPRPSLTGGQPDGPPVRLLSEGGRERP